MTSRAVDRAIATMARYGIKTILGTPTAAPPKWLTRKYPEVLHVFESVGVPDNRSRRHYCYNSVVYRRLSRAIVEALAGHYRDDPNVIGWQIDNELTTRTPSASVTSFRLGFRKWLQVHYRLL